MTECFVVDWPVAGETGRPSGSVVAVRMRGHQAGLYRVRQVMQEGVLLSHGAISFPVGTTLDVESAQGVMPGAWLTARVVANDQRGLSLVWS